MYPKNKKILAVEDSEIVQKIYFSIFKRYLDSGLQLISAMNGREALTQLNKDSDVDLILLDINMPEMDGLEFLKKVKADKKFKEIPVIIISTEGHERDLLRGLEAGATAYLTKPFQPHSLIQIIEKVIENSKKDV